MAGGAGRRRPPPTTLCLTTLPAWTVRRRCGQGPAAPPVARDSMRPPKRPTRAAAPLPLLLLLCASGLQLLSRLPGASGQQDPSDNGADLTAVRLADWLRAPRKPSFEHGQGWVSVITSPNVGTGNYTRLLLNTVFSLVKVRTGDLT